MRGADTFTERAFMLHRLEDFVPTGHLLRPIRQMVNEALMKMDDLFAGMYEADAKGGRPSIAPDKLLRAMLLQVFYSIRSERQLMEQVQYNLLYRWFIGLAMDEAVWRALQRGRHAHSGLQPQELCAQGRQRRRPGRRQFQGPEP